MLYVLNELENRIFSDSDLNLSDSSRIQICNPGRPAGFGFSFFEGRTDSDFENREYDHHWRKHDGIFSRVSFGA